MARSCRWLLSVVLGTLITSPVSAQNVYRLSLEESVQIALEKSYRMRTLRENLLAAENNLAAARGRFKTNANFSLDTPSFSEQVSEIPVPNALPIFNTTGIFMLRGNLDLIQPLPTDGRLILRGEAYRRNVATWLADQEETIKRNDFYTSLSLRFIQPLFTLNQLKLGLKQAQLGYEAARLRAARGKADLIYDVTSSYFALYRAQRQMEIAGEQVEQRRQAYDLAKRKFEAGLIPEVEALQLEVDWASAENQLTAARGTFMRQADAFKQLLGLELADSVVLIPDLSYRLVHVDEAEALHRALKNRPEVREAEIQEEQARLSVKEIDARSEVRADLLAYYDITGVSSPALPLGSSTRELFESSWSDMKRRPRNKGVSLTVSVPLWDSGVNKAEVMAATSALRTAQLTEQEVRKNVEREIRAAVQSLRETYERLTILERSRTVARKSYEVSLARFDNGEITAQELALAQNRLTSAEMSYLDAYVSYKLSLADLQRKTLFDYERGVSLIEE